MGQCVQATQQRCRLSGRGKPHIYIPILQIGIAEQTGTKPWYQQYQAVVLIVPSRGTNNTKPWYNTEANTLSHRNKGLTYLNAEPQDSRLHTLESGACIVCHAELYRHGLPHIAHTTQKQ